MKVIFLCFLIISHLFADEGVLIKNKEAALLVGEALLQAIYGENVLRQKPFKISETKEAWILDGTFHCPKGQHCLGGVAHLEFSKFDGRILKVTHGK